jgi:hypothetical protein
MQKTDRTETADADQRQQTSSRWTARIENGEAVYEQPTSGVETTDTEFVAKRTPQSGTDDAGGRA